MSTADSVQMTSNVEFECEETSSLINQDEYEVVNDVTFRAAGATRGYKLKSTVEMDDSGF